MKTRYLLLSALLCLWACSSTKPKPALAPAAKPDTAVAQVPALVPEEEMLFSEVTEFVELGQENVKDSLWFQAGEDFDSALVRLAALEATDSLSPSVYAHARDYRDSVQKLLIYTVAMTSQMSEPVPFTQQFDEQMEEVPDSSVKAMESITHQINPSVYDLPLPQPMENRVLQAMAVFMGQGRGYFTKWLSRRSRYNDMLQKKLAEKGLPHDLMYLAMVESGFNPKAWSKASASGMWQFISGTGRRYGLNDDWWYDPRRDPLQATDAALEYLRDLHDEFKDWHLAMAAYNCGEGKIRKLLAQDSTRGYWRMPLPQETRFYVPKILAAMIISHNPEKYGFKIENPEPALAFDTVIVNHCLTLATIAKAAGVTEDTIIELNPSLRRWCTPPNRSAQVIYLPVGTGDAFRRAYAKLDKSQLVSWHRHVVLKGETISAIAARYHVSVAAIKSTNKIKGNRLHRGQSLLIPLAPGDAAKYPEQDVAESQSHGGGKYRGGVYRVRNGDNLFDIARRFGTTVSNLLAANNLRRGAVIHKGQRLRLGGKGRGAGASDDVEDHHAPAGAVAAEELASTRIDAPGEDASDDGEEGTKPVAKKGTAVKETKAAKAPDADDDSDADDGDASAATALPPSAATATTAAAMETPAPAPVAMAAIENSPTAMASAPQAGKFAVHTVGIGETVFSICRKLGLREDDLAKWNHIPHSRIFVGQRLKYLAPGAAKTATAAASADDDESDEDGDRTETVSAGTPASHASAPIVRPSTLTLAAVTKASRPKPEEKQYYVVKEGDSLWDISVKYRSTVQKLKDLNGRLPTVLKPGTKIRVK